MTVESLSGQLLSTFSPNNSTTTALSGEATFTGTGEANDFPDVMVACKTDVAGTIYIDLSDDGTNYDTLTALQVVPSVLRTYTFVKGQRYYRIRYVNGASSQSYLRLYTYAGSFAGRDNADETAFETFATLNNAQTYSSDVLALNPTYSQVQTSVLASHSGSIIIYWYRDSGGTDLLRTLTIPYAASDGFQFFAAPAFTNFVKYTFLNNSGSNQTDFYYSTKFLKRALSSQVLRADGQIVGGMTADLTRSIVAGKTAGGAYDNVKITNQNALVVTPPAEGKTAFGEELVGGLVDQVLCDFAFANVDGVVITRANQSGGVTNASQLATVSTGAATYSSGELRSTNLVRYVPGHGTRARFTAKFTTGVADSTQLAGIGDESNGFFFGYDGTNFGICHRKNGSPEIRTLTVSSGANDGTGTDDITITLDGDTKVVTLTDFSSSTTLTANAIAAADYSDVGRGWTAVAIGATVVFTSWDAAPHTGTFSLTDTDSTGAAGSFTQSVAGVAPTDNWTAQASWNGTDIFNGSGITGVTLNPTRLNVYQIQYQYLGAGAIYFFVEDPGEGNFLLVHTIAYANSATATSLGNPHLPLMIAAENTDNNTNLSVSSASMSGMTDGTIELTGVRRALSANTGSVSAATPCIVLCNKPVFAGKKNTNKLKILSISATSTIASGNSTARIDLVKNAVLTEASFADVDATNSFVSYDTAATAATGGTVVLSEQSVVNTTTRFDSNDANDLLVQPGDTLTVLCTPSSNNTTTYVSVQFTELL